MPAFVTGHEAVAADVLLRQEADEEEEDEANGKKDDDDETDDGYFGVGVLLIQSGQTQAIAGALQGGQRADKRKTETAS
jgi:hypothetical protein